MLKSIYAFFQRLFSKAPLKPLNFPDAGFKVLADDAFVEEDYFPEFKDDQFYRVKIGDVYHSKYQVVGKLGYGSTSTVWLARDLVDHSYRVLKIYIQDVSGDKDNSEFRNYEIIGKANRKHPGYKHVRTALSLIELQRVAGNGDVILRNDCLVQNPHGIAGKLFLALDYLHTECKLVHTDISPQNIMTTVADKGVFKAFTETELRTPSSRKIVGGTKTVYQSRDFQPPRKFGISVLGDFGAAVCGDEYQYKDVQPNVYRAPEVMLRAEWSYPIDIWNVGCMILDLYLGRHLFYGKHPDGSGYKTGAHLAEIVALMGPPPLDLLKRGDISRQFFTEKGQWRDDIGIPLPDISIESVIEDLDVEERFGFLNFIQGMLEWRPEDRKTAKELYNDPWLQDV